jgi:hypothetical protein
MVLVPSQECEDLFHDVLEVAPRRREERKRVKDG